MIMKYLFSFLLAYRAYIRPHVYINIFKKQEIYFLRVLKNVSKIVNVAAHNLAKVGFIF